jgi:hypothetical protein
MPRRGREPATFLDGTQSDMGVYLELARNYQKRKQWQREWPAGAGRQSAIG